MRSTRMEESNQLSRRAFTAHLATGLASSLLVTSPGLAAESRQVGVKRFLFVTNDPQQRVDVFDIAAGHSLVRSFPMAGNKVGGACADAASNRLFISQQTADTVTAYDLRTAEVLWHVDTMQVYGLNHPDRISITVDGKALYVPMKSSDQTLILDTATGKRITQFERPGRPHNSWSGEMGRYMYVAGRSNHMLYLTDQRTHEVVKKIGPFSWPVRPFSVDRQERYVYANVTYLVGFAVADIQTGEIAEIRRLPPIERTRYWDKAKVGLPHGDHPFSHGIAVRPGAQEVWYLDDQWGYLNVFDTSKSAMKPAFKGQVELFDKIDEPWQVPREKDVGNCWVAFSLDGRYCYPSDGSVIDAEAGKKTRMRISPSEKLIEVEFRDGVAKRVSGQMGGVYG